ncbi:MAG: hypothetical protein OXH00_18490 [Candidatus Poribacteria bacterium]|nr:hypothetical protein [Candidatus Poribacteria bacterium]
MLRLINVPRYTLIVSGLLVFIFFSPIAVAKHIIVIYDVSGSMVSLKMGRNTKVYMESEDIRRVNEYLTNLLFTNTSQSLRDMDDSYIKECDAAYVGKPLYQGGDILTYAEYAKQRVTKINRAPVSKSEFQRQLPNSMTLRESFYGMVSYLLRAEVEVYDALYSDTDDETYWVFVTDGDIDNSGKSDPGISEVLKRHAEIEDEFHSPMIFSMLVNKHVRIQVRKLQKSDVIDSIFLATSTELGKRVREIQLDRDDEGKFISETLTVKTHNSKKPKFKLDSVNVEIVDKFNKPLQIVTEENTFGVVEVPSVSLHGNPPPFEFRILFPAHREIAAPGNALKLEITYSFNGKNKIHSPQPIKYTPRIDSIYVSNLDNSEQQTKELNLNFSEDTYHVGLAVQSESYNKKAFRIDQLRCQVQYKDGRKLCDVTVPKVGERLGEPFSMVVPKRDRLDWRGNKIVLEIDYKYENETKSATIEIPYKLIGGGSGFPMWLLWVFLIPILSVILFLLIRRLIPYQIAHHIGLTQVSQAGTPLGEKAYFMLKNKMTLEFGPRGPDELQFDIGSEAFLYCDKKNLLLFADADDDEGRILDLPEILMLNQGDDDDEIRINCEIVDNTSNKPEDDDEPIIWSNNASDTNPLDV